MIAKAEGLFGPYDWDRYDMLVLPPSFPYGGMENPRMTFLTPTLLAGDRSLVDVVAHELAHSWTGNLVTNATMEHFWLNEGFTVWAERRILEALHGEEAAALALGDRPEGAGRVDRALRRGLAADAAAHRPRRHRPRRRLLVRPLREGRPLRRRSSSARPGAQRFDRFMREYMKTLPLHLHHHRGVPGFPRAASCPASPRAVDATAWLYEPGHARRTRRSSGREKLDAPRGARPRAGRRASGPTPQQIAGWTPPRLLVYLQHLPRELDRRRLRLAGRDASR